MEGIKFGDCISQIYQIWADRKVSTASGYNHTYSDLRRLDLAALSMFPNDDEIANKLTPRAFEEVKGLWEILGVNFDSLRRQPAAFPSISSWFSMADNDAASEKEEDGVSDEGSDMEEETESWDREDDFVCGVDEMVDPDDAVALELQRHIDYFEDEFTTSAEDSVLNGLAYAATMISVQDTEVM